MDIQPNLVDLNTADHIELRNVPGIGAKLADRIISARPFAELDDIRRVSGVGPALFNQLKPYITVTSSTGASAQINAATAAPKASSLPDEADVVSLPPQPAEGTLSIPAETEEASMEPEALPAGEADLPVGEMKSGEETPGPASADVSAGESTPVVEPLVPAPPPPAAPEAPVSAQPSGKGVTRAELYGIAAVSGVLSFILAIFFTLIFLGLINGGLRFVRPDEMRQLASQVSTLDAQSSQLSGDIDSLKSRLAAMESLDGRVTGVEQDARQLRQDVEAVSGTANALGKRIDDLSFQIDALIARTGRFQNFLDGLRDLINNLNQLEAP
jgi:outer membrane murein-binding lipoprotein Lpp